MTSAEPTSSDRRPRRWRIVLGAGCGVVILAGATVWLARGPIAETLARDWLRRHGVTAALQVRSLSPTGLTARISLGDPRDPVLSVDELQVGYALTGPWNGQSFGVETRTLRLVRPHLKLRLADGRLDYGPMQRLIDDLSKAPQGKGPTPDLAFEDAVVELLMPDGRLTFRGRATLKKGRLEALSGAVDPFTLQHGDLRLSAGGGPVSGSRRGEMLTAGADFGPIEAVESGQRLHIARAQLNGEAPYPNSGQPWRGPARVALSALGVSGSMGGGRGEQGSLDADLDGNLDLGSEHPAFRGRMQASARLAALEGPAARLRGVAATLDLDNVALTGGDAVRISGAGKANLTGSGQDSDGAQFSLTGAPIGVRTFDLTFKDGWAKGSASLEGSLAGHGSMPARAAARLAGAAPLLGGEPAYRKAIEQGLKAFRVNAPAWRGEITPGRTQFAFAAPVRIESGSGARLVMAPTPATLTAHGASGGGSVTLDGGGLPKVGAEISRANLATSGYRADLSVHGMLDALIARDATLQARGRLTGSGRSLRFDLAGCASESARRLALDPNPVTEFSATLCPGERPLLTVTPKGWTASGRFENASGSAPSFEARGSGAAGTFTASGSATLQAATVALDKGDLTDTSAETRFRPLSISGHATLGGGAWSGAFLTATAKGRPIARIDLRQDVTSGAGRADIATGALAFAPTGLQPADISPLAQAVRHADGVADFEGWISWTKAGQGQSGGELTTRNFKFIGPTGAVTGLSTDLKLTSLVPLVTAPHQTITVGQVQSATPLSGLNIQFDLNARRISIDTATGQLAQGHIRLEPTVAPLAAGSEVKGELVLDRVDLGEIVAASSLSDSVKLSAVVDGRIPFVIGPDGIRILKGQLAATGPGRLTISRKALGQATAPPGMAEDLAYQAMENLAFDSMDASLNSLPGDRLGILFHIKGRHAPPKKQEARISLSSILRGKPLEKPLTLPSDTAIDLTLDTSLNFGELVRSAQEAWRESLGPAAKSSAPVHGAKRTTPKQQTEPQ